MLFGNFEVFKKIISEKKFDGKTSTTIWNFEKKFDGKTPTPVLNFISGSLGGLTYWLSVYPIDVVKSAIQTDTIVK